MGLIIGLALIHSGPVPSFLSKLALEAIVNDLIHVYGHADMNAKSLHEQGVLNMGKYVACCLVSFDQMC